MFSTEEKKNTPYRNPSSFRLIDGILYPPGISKDFLQKLQHLTLQVDEVIVVTYPKSGITWLSEVTWQIFSDGRTNSEPIRLRVPYLEGLAIYRNIKTEDVNDVIVNTPYPRLFKTHLPHHLAPKSIDTNVKPKYICLMRNPKDIAVSYYHFYKGFKIHEFDGEWEEFLELFMAEDVMFSSWFDHVLGWWAHRDEPNCLVLKYEDMAKDQPSVIQKIAAFVGKSLSLETVQRIVDQTTFNFMSKVKGAFYDGDEVINRQRVPGASKFLRKGKVGDWRNYFTEDQSRRFDELYNAKIKGSGLDFEFLPRTAEK